MLWRQRQYSSCTMYQIAIQIHARPCTAGFTPFPFSAVRSSWSSSSSCSKPSGPARVCMLGMKVRARGNSVGGSPPGHDPGDRQQLLSYSTGSPGMPPLSATHAATGRGSRWPWALLLCLASLGLLLWAWLAVPVALEGGREVDRFVRVAGTQVETAWLSSKLGHTGEVLGNGA